MVDVESFVAKVGDLFEVVGHKNDGDSFGFEFQHFGKTLVLKTGVADCQDFVNNENFWVNVDGNREGQTHIHS